MQAPHQKQAKKALKRQDKNTKVHQAREIALMLGASPVPGVDGEGTIYGSNSQIPLHYQNRQVMPGHQSTSMPQLQQVVNHHQMSRMASDVVSRGGGFPRHQGSGLGLQPLQIASPMGQVVQQVTPGLQQIPGTALSQGAPGSVNANGKMFQRGLAQQHQSGYPATTAQTTKGSMAVTSLLQQQMRGKPEKSRQHLAAQHHGNYPSQMQAVNQKIFYPMAQAQAKSSRSRTQLSSNMQQQYQQLPMTSSAEAFIPVSTSVHGQHQIQNNHLFSQMPQQHQNQSASNIMMRQGASTTQTRPKRGATANTANQHQQHQQSSNPAGAGGRKSKQPSVNNLINSSLMANKRDQQKQNRGGGTRQISRPMTSHHNLSGMSVTPHAGGAYALPQNLNAASSGVYDAHWQPIDNHNAVIRSSRSNTRNNKKNIIGSTSVHHQHPQNHEYDSPSKQRSKGRSVNKKKSTTPQSVNSRQQHLVKSPPVLALLEHNGLVSQLPKINEAAQLGAPPVSSILTATVLEAKLQVDMSSFLHKMQVYCQVSLQTLGVQERDNPPEPEPQQKRSKSSQQAPSKSGQVPVILESIIRKTQTVAGMEPKWSECFVFDLKGASEYLLELSVWSSNYLVRDSCIGRAFLKFDGSHSETGSITNWIALKSEQGEGGEVFVSISKEAIPPTNDQIRIDQKQNRQQNNQLYKTHMAQNNTEECIAVGGDSDDHNFGQDLNRQIAAGTQAFAGNQHPNASVVGGRFDLRPPEESEVNSAEEEGDNYLMPASQQQPGEAFSGESEVEEADGLDSPVDDIIFEEEQQLQRLEQNHHQKMLMQQAYQTQHPQVQQLQYSLQPVAQDLYLYQQSQMPAQEEYQQLDETTTDGELDEQLRAVPKSHNNQQLNAADDFSSEEDDDIYKMNNKPSKKLHQNKVATRIKPNNRSQKLTVSQRQHLQQQKVHNGANTAAKAYGQHQQNFANNNHSQQMQQMQMQQYHTGGFRKNHPHAKLGGASQNRGNRDVDSAAADSEDFAGQDDEYDNQGPNNLPRNRQMHHQNRHQSDGEYIMPDHDDDGNSVEENEGVDEYGSLGDGDEDYDLEDGEGESFQDKDAAEIVNDGEQLVDPQLQQYNQQQQQQIHLQQQLAAGGINNPNLIYQLQHQNDELAGLQKDIVEENARLRHEVISIDKIQKKIEKQDRQNKHEKSNLRQLRGTLRSKSKRIGAQQEQLVYERQQLEKESIKVNKQLQKMRRMRQTLEQASQVCGGLVKSEIFSKLRYEASLTQHSHNGTTNQHDTSDDWLLAMQAHEFVTNFDKVRQMLDQVVSDNTLQGGATGSGDLNNKIQGGQVGSATVQTTQHQQHASQSSLATQGALSSNLARKQGQQPQPYQKSNNPNQQQHQNGKSQQFMSDDTSICGDRNMLAGIDQSPGGNHKPKNQEIRASNENNKTQEAYWTHSSIREIRAQGTTTNIVLQNSTSNPIADRSINEISTPNLTSKLQHEQQRPASSNSVPMTQVSLRHYQVDRSAPTGKNQIVNSQSGLNNNYQGGGHPGALGTTASNIKPSQSTLLSPSRHKNNQIMQSFPEQSRFHTEVEEPHHHEPHHNLQDNNETASVSNNNQVQASREVYARHLDMDLDMVSNANLQQQRADQQQQQQTEISKNEIQQTQQAYLGGSTFQVDQQIPQQLQSNGGGIGVLQKLQQIMTASSSMTPEPAAHHPNPLFGGQTQDAMQSEQNKLFLTRQVTAVPQNIATPGSNNGNLILQQQQPDSNNNRLVESGAPTSTSQPQMSNQQFTNADQSRISSAAIAFTNGGGMLSSAGNSTMARHQEIYSELIGQMSKELSDFREIKQNLLQIAQESSQQQTKFQPQNDNNNLQLLQSQEMSPQLDGQAETQQNDTIGLEALKLQQMQFLMEQQQQMEQEQQQELLSSRNLLQNQNQEGDNDDLGQEEGDDDGDKEVEGYIWESMQRNAQRMQQLKNEKGIQDPVELERELLRNFKTNEFMQAGATSVNHEMDDHQQHLGEVDRDQSALLAPQSISNNEVQDYNQDDQKFTSSYIVDTAYPAAQHIYNSGEQAAQNNQQHMQETNQAEIEDGFEFKFDPDFLNKINANMAMNDQINGQRMGTQEDQQNNDADNYSPQVEEHYQANFAPDLFQQATLQGEQTLFDRVGEVQDGNDGQSQHSFISTEQVEDSIPVNVDSNGPSFIMDYSNNNGDMRQSLIGASSRVSTNGQYLQGGASIEKQQLPHEITRIDQVVQNQSHSYGEPDGVRQNTNSNGTGSGGAAPATLIKNTTTSSPQQHQHTMAEDGQEQNFEQFQSPTTSTAAAHHYHHLQHQQQVQQQQQQAHSSRESQKGSVVLPQQSFSGGKLTNTVQKMEDPNNIKYTNSSQGVGSIIRMENIDTDNNMINIINKNSDPRAATTNTVTVENQLHVPTSVAINPHDENQQMTANDFEISNRSSVRGFNEQEDDISRMINEQYLDGANDNRNQSVIYKDDKVFDQPKRALYGIQPAKETGNTDF